VPRKSENKTNEVSDPQGASYVYDFLYYDARRIGSFQAQLGAHGTLQKVRRHQGSSEDSSYGATAKAAGGVPAVANLEAGTDNKQTTRYDESVDQEYDPFWINGLTLFEDLDKHGLINRQISTARIGQFVLIKGSLSVLDFSTLKVAWKSPSIRAMMSKAPEPLAQNATGADRRARKEAVENQERTLSLSIDVLESMPHTVQATVISGSDHVWSTLWPEGLVAQSSDILLKHGFDVGGEWAVLGIVDAVPDDSTVPDVPAGYAAINVKSVNAAAGTILGAMVATLAPIARTMLGRPSNAYGITPLLIFREVS
jgi:hypothetical protein